MKFFDFFKRKAVVERREPSFRSYAGAAGGRQFSDWRASTTSADTELKQSLRVLRNRSRSLVRDNCYARRCKALFQNNIIGQGIGMQMVRQNESGQRMDAENERIELAWWDWAMSTGCHTGGVLSLTDILRLMIGEVYETGEVLVRFVPKKFGDSKVPLALEVIEAERIVEHEKSITLRSGHTVRMGVECDEWGRPVAYWCYRGHPGDSSSFRGFNSHDHIRIPADECVHLYRCDRWPQHRGEPWLSSVLKRLRDVGEYTNSEMVAARAAANIMGFFKRPDESISDTEDDDDQDAFKMEPGMIWKLRDGESFEGFSPARPNAALDPFLRFMVREVATGVGVSYESLSKDYSKSNYSSSRLSILDDRQAFRVLQQWVIRVFLFPLFRQWFRQASLAGVIRIKDAASAEDEWLHACRFRPPGWSWVDPTKEIAAAIAAVQAGFTTVGDVIALNGGGTDPEDIFKARRKELDLLESLGLEFSTSTPVASPQTETEKNDDSEETEDDETKEGEDTPSSDDGRNATATSE